MNTLFRVLYAAHAKGTHHKLALDALRHLDGLDADAWCRVFLKHAELLMLGSKAPDDEFKDFTNHVLHPRDKFWGGAPVKARSWYGHLVTGLRQQDWPTAVYATGVLSHYLTDPLMPFHTGQSQAENNIHRAAEWSISRSYDALWRMADELPPPVVAIADADNWLEMLVCDGASEANRHYERLIAHYDFTRGVVDPPAGLDAVAQRLVAELLARAGMTVGKVLRRAISEAGVTPPEVTLTLETVVAALEIPVKTLQKRLADGADRRAVERMYDELQATGRVEVNLPEDDRIVRETHAREVLAKVAQFAPAAQFPYQGIKPPETSIERAARLREENRRRALEDAARRVAAQAEARAAAKRVAVVEAEPSPALAPAPAPASVTPESEPVPSVTHAGPSLVARLDEHERIRSGPVATLAAAPETGLRFYLAREHDIVDAPSIGPKTAARLIEAGLMTVGDFLDAEPVALAKKLKTRHITAETLRDWQDQSRLVIAVPDLRGTHAQLIVGAGFRDAASLAATEPADLCARVLAFAATSDGQRILRNGDPPDIEAITGWGASAQQARAA